LKIDNSSQALKNLGGDSLRAVGKYSGNHLRRMYMRNGILGLVILAIGCDFRTVIAPPSPIARVAPSRGRQISTNRDVEEQLEEIEQRLQTQPNDIGLLKTKAQLLQGLAVVKIQGGDRAGGYTDYEASGELWRKIKTTTPALTSEDAVECSTAIYNLACALSLKKQIEPAFAALRESVESGFSNMERFQNDPDLDPLRDQPGFKSLLEELPKLRLTAAKRLIAPESLFPFEFSLSSIHDKTIASKDYEGKILIVDVWGTWCGPCRQEIPSFVALHRKYKGKGLEIAGINYEREPDPLKMKKVVTDFIAQNGIAYECVIGDERTQQRIPGFGGYPTTLFIDRQGRMRAKFEGAQAYETLESVVELLLAEPEASLQ
jgi:thiol-disulfide isomerase/thioredoxin